MKFDGWQKAVLDYKGNTTIRAGRQVGKSTVISEKVKRFAKEHKNVVILCIAPAQRQSSYLFEKIRGLFDSEDELRIDKKVKQFRLVKKVQPTLNELKKLQEEASIYDGLPTQTRIVLKNGSKIYSLPAGRTGIFIKGLTIDLLVADEAAYIPEIVWNAVLPMVAVSKKLRGFGWILLLSTPFGKGGYFYHSHHDSDFKQFHISSEACPRISKKFLAKERERMSKEEYAQEYLGEFIDDYRQFFPTKLIKKCMTFIDWSFEKDYDNKLKYYLGVDIARYGGDENAFVVTEMDRKKNLRVVKVLTTSRMSTADTIGRVLILDSKFKFKRIYVDDAGVGGGVTDILIEKLGRKIIGLNNASRTVDYEGKKGRILKEDLYSNALILMEAGKLDLISNLQLLRSMRSITFEYSATKRIKISGAYSHITEAYVRSVWCIKDSGLRLFLH